MTGTTVIHIPGSIGDLYDKISILEIKASRMTDPVKLLHVTHELALLRAIEGDHQQTGIDPRQLIVGLKQVNESLWEIEDDIRDCERRQDFGATFIALARSVYKTNDRRASLKKQLNDLYGSEIVEQKSYAPQTWSLSGEG